VFALIKDIPAGIIPVAMGGVNEVRNYHVYVYVCILFFILICICTFLLLLIMYMYMYTCYFSF